MNKAQAYVSVLLAFSPAHLLLVRVYPFALLEQPEELARVPWLQGLCARARAGGGWMTCWPVSVVAGMGA